MAIPPEQFYGRSREITPEPSLLTPNAGTPTRQGQTTSLPFSSGGIFIETAFVEAARELKGKFSVVSTENFLETYLPDAPRPMPEFKRKPFRKVANQSAEKHMYELLIEALNPYLEKGWTLENTSASPDPDSGFFHGHKIKPDLTLYSTQKKKASNENKCRSCDMETFIELKFDVDEDGFGDDIEEPEKISAVARDTRGQLITYLNAMQASQYRTHGFGVLLTGKRCRLLRHTHSGVEVTTQFDYTTRPYLATFFWRLSCAQPSVRGIDDTFERATCEEASVILNAVGEPLWKVRVDNHYYYVSVEFTRSHRYPVGRGTRCFVAVDCDTMQKCVLKDTWRVIGYHREGEVYERLHKHSVRNIPTILAEADVAGDTHTCGVLGPAWRFPSTGYTVRRHQHYRIVLGVVGEPMSGFQSTWELNKIVLHAFQAHHDAVVKANVDHRDVSVGNIIIVRSEDGKPSSGMLIDWELSKYHEEEGARVYEKTGTLQFTAARLFEEQLEIRTFADDLESFVLVYLWCAARYAPNKMTPVLRGQALREFDSQASIARAKILLAGRATAYYYKLSSPHLYQILHKILEHYKYRYSTPTGDPEEDEKAERIKDEIEKHDWMENALNEASENKQWEAILDRSVDQELKLENKEDTKKRKSQFTEYQMVFERRMKQRGERGPIPIDDSDGI